MENRFPVRPPSILHGPVVATGCWRHPRRCTLLVSLGEGSSPRNSHRSSRRNVIAKERSGQATWLSRLWIRVVCCQRLVIFPSVEGWQLHLGCRLCMRTSDSPARQRHAGWEVIDHQRSTRLLNWGNWLAFLLLWLVLRNFSACFRWYRRTAGGTAFALAPEPFQGILRPSLPYLLWSNSMIVSCGNRLRVRTLHSCHLMLIR
jgi:hypothetical protein